MPISALGKPDFVKDFPLKWSILGFIFKGIKESPNLADCWQKVKSFSNYNRCQKGFGMMV